jgi:CUB domain
MFTDFELEAHVDCTYDRVEVYDGEEETAPRLGRFCGSNKPAPGPIIASSNHMYMTFSSDASVQRKGFLATHSTGTYVDRTVCRL